MSNRENKSTRPAADLVNDLAKHGVTFNYISKEEAANYFTDRNNFLRTASYRKNYVKHTCGNHEGKYINLDFLALVELSTIDMYLRRHLLRMCIDIEHALKVKLITDIENDGNQDGYQVVDDFLKSRDGIKKNIAWKAGAVFAGDLVSKYFEVSVIEDEDGRRTKVMQNIDCPAWVLVELLSFRDFTDFADFYYKDVRQEKNKLYNRAILNSVRSLRNACAHNNCLLNDLNHTSSTSPTAVLSGFLVRLGVAKGSRDNNLSTRPMLEITSMLYEYDLAVSPKVKESGLRDLQAFLEDRAIEKKNLLSANSLLLGRYTYLRNLVDALV